VMVRYWKNIKSGSFMAMVFFRSLGSDERDEWGIWKIQTCLSIIWWCFFLYTLAALAEIFMRA